jgi:NAD(P)-dependent dehydrogenase (short-subunit alcohol dehydrogenase family)
VDRRDVFAAGAFLGKTVFVAGGSSGINLGIAERFAALGARIALISRKEERVRAAVEALGASGATAFGVAADVRDYAAVEAAFDKAAAEFGPLDVVVSGAAGNFLAPVLGMSANAFRTVVEIDLIGTFNVFRACYSYLRRPGASLIAITAGQARQPAVFQAHACAAKAGVDMLTRTLAMEWGPAGVRVNAIAPGPIADTEGMARLTPSPEAEARLKSRLALRNYGTKRDIGDMAVFLASDNAAYVTGAIFDCDGGLMLGDASADAFVAPPRADRREAAPMAGPEHQTQVGG